MEEQVKDIAEALQSLQADMQSMREVVESQHVQICQLTRSNQRLTKENKELRKRLSKHEQPPKDSSNSSVPPSKDSMKCEVVRRTSSLRPKSDKSVGGQVGHMGFTRQTVDVADEITDQHSDYCNECGAELSGAENVFEYALQEIDIPVIRPVIKEHRHYAKMCKCGYLNRSYEPRKRGGSSIVFGKNVQALVVYYNVVQCIPYERLQSMLGSVYGIEMSQGTISNIIQSAKKKAEPIIALIKDFISNSSVVGFDESGCYCQGRLDWSWIAQTTYHTLVFRASGRGGKVLEDMFGDALKNMTAVTDRHSAYFALNFLGHQICLAHILRELKYLSKVDTGQQWSKEVEGLLKEAIRLRNENPKVKIDTSPWLEKLDKLLQRNLDRLDDGFRRLKNGLIKCRDYIFKFLENPTIPSDNNASERGFRKLKVKQKVSGTFRSDNGADAYFALHSIMDTAHKNKQLELDAIRAML
ncbi:MAG: IS66 family transposase [Dysgonamonadaceae bacterium]